MLAIISLSNEPTFFKALAPSANIFRLSNLNSNLLTTLPSILARTSLSNEPSSFKS